MTQVSMPSLTDDTGDGLSGTPLDDAYFTDVGTAIDAVTHSATNPTVSPADIIDEVVAARGSEADLDTRLSVALNADGTIKTSALPGSSNVYGDHRNFILDPQMIVWASGDTALPSCWGEVGTAGTYARCGSGLTDTNRKFGPWALYVSASGGADSKVQNTLMASYDDGFDGVEFTAGAWVLCSSANAARLAITDGAATSYSSYHTGGGTWEWLTVQHTVDASATSIGFQLQTIRNYAAYFAGATMQLGDTALVGPAPGYYEIQHREVWTTGNISVVDGFGSKVMRIGEIAYFSGLAARINTAPTTQAIILDCDWSIDGSSWNAIYSTRPTIAIAANSMARSAPDGTYRYRCFTSNYAFRINVDQIGSGTVGADLRVDASFVVPRRGIIGGFPGDQGY